MKIYMAPLLMDSIIFLIMFVVMYRAGESNLSKILCMLLGISVGIGYMVSSFISGKVVNQKKSRDVLLAGTFSGIFIAVIILFSKTFLSSFLLLIFFGISNGFFFNSFQTFMRNRSVEGEIYKKVGLYTFFWSMGVSVGFLSSGALYRLGPVYLSVITVLSGILIVLLIQYKHNHLNFVKVEQFSDDSFDNCQTNPLFLWIGWIMIFAVSFVQRSIQTFFPVISAQANISPFMTGLPLFLMMFSQAVLGFYIGNLKNIFYKRNFILCVHIFVIFILLVLWQFPYYLVHILGFTLLGLYGAFVYFSSVLYANNHYRNRSYNVGMNELFVGASSILGIILSYFWMESGISNGNAIYLGCAIFLLLTLFLILKINLKS